MCIRDRANSAVLASATADNNGKSITFSTASVSQSGNNITFDPGSDFDFLAAGETASVTINYTVTDDDGTPLTDNGTLSITVTGTNDGPSAVADTGSTTENSSVTVDVIANDTDPDTTDSLSLQIGSASIASATTSSGCLLYTSPSPRD